MLIFHGAALLIERRQFLRRLHARFLHVGFEARENVAGDALACLLDAGKIIRRAKACGDFPGFLAQSLRDRDHPALKGQGNVCAPIAFGEIEAAFSKRLGEGGARVRHRPAFLDQGIEFSSIASRSFGVLPFIQTEVARIALFGIHKPARHLPAVFEIELLGDFARPVLEEGQRTRRHGLRIDPRPDRVTMSAAFLFMEDEDAGLTCKSVLFFDGGERLLERLDPHIFFLRRVQRDGKEELLAARPATDGFRLAERPQQIGGHEAPNLMDFDMLILGFLEEMIPKLASTAALRTFQDHAASPFRPQQGKELAEVIRPLGSGPPLGLSSDRMEKADGKETLKAGGDRCEAPAGRCAGVSRPVGGRRSTIDRRHGCHLLPMAF